MDYEQRTRVIALPEPLLDTHPVPTHQKHQISLILYGNILHHHSMQTVVPRHNGKEVDLTSDILPSVKLRVRVLKGKRATGVANSGIHAWVKMTEEPFEDTDSTITVIYELTGLATDKCSFNCFDADGRRIPIDGPHACSRNPQRSTVGFWRPKIPIQKIAHIEMSLGDK